MAKDAFEPGPLGNYPAWPRNPDGTPDPDRMPTGLHWTKDKKTGERVLVDMTPRRPDGSPIVPPSIPPV